MGLYASLATAQVSLRARLRDSRRAGRRPSSRATRWRRTRCVASVEFSHVTLSFGRGRPALERLSFRVGPGEVLAIVGPSGSGKSTVADLLLRLLDPDEGVVRLDGVDLRRFNLRVLRRHVALVEQDPCILHASIGENIRYSRPDATDADVRRGRAVRRRSSRSSHRCRRATTRLSASAVRRCRPVSVSASRRRGRFSPNPAVLILDEPTASLDPHSERTVIDGYETVMRHRTTIVITHRLDVASRADRVLVLDGSRLVEQGAPAELALRTAATRTSSGAACPLTDAAKCRSGARRLHCRHRQWRARESSARRWRGGRRRDRRARAGVRATTSTASATAPPSWPRSARRRQRPTAMPSASSTRA